MITLDKFVGDVFPVEYNPVYNRTNYKLAVAAESTDVELVVGTPVLDGSEFVGFSLVAGTVKKGETADIPVMSNGFGVVVNAGALPASITNEIKTKAKTLGFKFV